MRRLFFFFKQKTAYEITYGDWSSDVCSSDLSTCRTDGRRQQLPWRPSPLRGHVLSGPLDRLHDVVVARAAAEVALELVADLRLRGLRVTLEHLIGRHDHPGGAEPALQPVFLPEPLLDRVQLAILRQPLDRHDVGAVHLDGEEGAGLDGLAVHEDRARAALAGVTADVCPGEADGLADVVHQEKAGLHFVGDALAVDRHLDWQFHDSSSGIRRFESGP